MEKKENRKTSYAQLISGVALLALVFVTAGLTVARLAVGHIPLTQYTDNLFGKFKLIGLNTRITETLSGGDYMESSEVLLGRDGWLFYKVMTDGTPLYDYMGINRFSEDELASIRDGLQAENEFMKSRGIKYAVLTIPNKEQVYDIYMPDTIERISDTSRLDQLTEYLTQAGTEYPYIDMTDIYIRNRDKCPLYYKTDTHYTDVGAYATVITVMDAMYGRSSDDDISSYEKTLLPVHITEIDGTDKDVSIEISANINNEDKTEANGLAVAFTARPGFEGDLARISATLDRYKDVSYNMDPATIREEDRRDETLLIIGDSFGDAMQHVAKYYYREVYFVQSTDYTTDVLDVYQPDAVIRECVERYLPRLTEL